MIGELSPTQPGPSAHFEPRVGRSLSLDHAAELLHVSRRTVYNRIREGRLKTVRTRGGSQRVTLDSLLQAGVPPAAVLLKPAEAIR